MGFDAQLDQNIGRYLLCTALQQTNSLQRLEMILLLFQTQQVHLISLSTEIQNNTNLLFYSKTLKSDLKCKNVPTKPFVLVKYFPSIHEKK